MPLWSRYLVNNGGPCRVQDTRSKLLSQVLPCNLFHVNFVVPVHCGKSGNNKKHPWSLSWGGLITSNLHCYLVWQELRITEEWGRSTATLEEVQNMLCQLHVHVSGIFWIHFSLVQGNSLVTIRPFDPQEAHLWLFEIYYILGQQRKLVMPQLQQVPVKYLPPHPYQGFAARKLSTTPVGQMLTCQQPLYLLGVHSTPPFIKSCGANIHQVSHNRSSANLHSM